MQTLRSRGSVLIWNSEGFCATQLPWNGGPRVITLAFMKVYLASRLVSIMDDFLSLGFVGTIAGKPLDDVERKKVSDAVRGVSEKCGELVLPMTKTAADRYLLQVPSWKDQESNQAFHDF